MKLFCIDFLFLKLFFNYFDTLVTGLRGKAWRSCQNSHNTLLYLVQAEECCKLHMSVPNLVIRSNTAGIDHSGLVKYMITSSAYSENLLFVFQGLYSQRILRLKVAPNSQIQEQLLKIMGLSVVTLGLFFFQIRVIHKIFEA